MSSKEESDFSGRGLARIGRVDRILLNVQGDFLPQGSTGRPGWISRSDQRSQIGDGVFLFKQHWYNRAGSHKTYQTFEKWLAPVDIIKPAGFLLGQVFHPHIRDPETGLFQSTDDMADQFSLDRIRLDYQKRSFQQEVSGYA
jgi:hypothetical protein